MSKTDHILRIRFVGDEAEIVGATKKTVASVKSVGTASDQTANKLNRLDKETRQASQSSDQLTGSYSKLRGAVYGLGVGYAAIRLVDTIGETQTLNIRLQELSGSTSAYTANQEFLRDSAQLLRKDFFVLGNGYAKILALQQGGIVTQTESRELLIGLSNASAALGASNTQLSQSLYGMSQGLSQAIVRAEELNQVVEPMPGLLQAMDKAAQLPAGGFRQLVVDGKITSEMFKETLIGAFNVFEGAAERAGKTIPAAMTDINNAYAEVAAALETPINAALLPVLEGIAAGIRVLPEFAGEAQTLLTILSAYAAVRFLPGLIGGMTSRAYASSKAFISAGTAVDIYGAKVRVATVSQRIFNSTLAALGGPLGILATLLITGAIELYNYKSAADDAIDSTRNWGKEIEKTISIYDRFIEKQKEATKQSLKGFNYEEAKVRLEQVTAEIKKFEEQLAKLKSINASAARIGALERKLQSLHTEFVLLRDPIEKGASGLEKYTKNIIEQTLEFGKSKQEVRLLNTEQKILEERSKLGTTATRSQVLAFEDFADRARKAATALNELETQRSQAEGIKRGNKESGRVIDLSAERAKRLQDEANSYAASAELRANEHQIRLAQIKGNLDEENLLRFENLALQAEFEERRFTSESKKTDERYKQQVKVLAERRKLALETQFSSEEEKQQVINEIREQRKLAEDSYREETEAAERIHEGNLVQIKREGEEARAAISKRFGLSQLAATGQVFGALAQMIDGEGKKAFEIRKKLSIAQQLVELPHSIQQSYENGGGYPWGIIPAIAMGIAGTALIRQTKSQTYSSSGSISASSSGGSISSAPRPTSNVVPFSPPPQAQLQNQTNQQDSSNFQNETVVENHFHIGNIGRDSWDEFKERLNNGEELIERKTRNAQTLREAS